MNENEVLSFDQADIDANKVVSAIGYLGILFLVPMLATKDSAYARFHSNQGLVNFLAMIACSIIMIIPIVGTIIGFIGYLVCVVFAIMGIVNAATGKAKELPLIGKFRIIK